MKMNTRQLRYLLAVSRFGSVSNAAAHLGISQPALSKLIGKWEETCGFPIFLRFGRKLTPTAIGRLFLDYAQRILDEQNRMILTMRSMGGERGQSIRLCTAPNRAAIIYSEIFHRFARVYPDIELSLIEQYAIHQPSAVMRGKADLALGVGPVSTEVEDIPIARDELLVALPASHPLSGREKIQLKELRDTPFVLQGHLNYIRTITDSLFPEAGFEPVVVFESNDVFLLDAMLRKGAGAGFVSRIHANPCEEVRYLSLDPPVFQMIHIRYPKGRVLTDPQKYLAGLLIRQRLQDSRYIPINSPAVQELLDIEKATTQDTLSMPSGPIAGGTAKMDDYSNEISLDTDVLKYMIAIVDEKSLSRAADRFYLAQPALSRHLRNMENMFGMQLFSRKHNRLYPTNIGKVFVNSARNILLFEEELNREMSKYRTGHVDKITVHCDPVLAEWFHRKIERLFSETNPDIKIAFYEADAEQTVEALQNASSEIGILLTCQPAHDILDYEIIGAAELVYCRDPNEPPLPYSTEQGHGKIISPENSPAHGNLMIVSDGTALRREQDRLISSLFKERPKIIAEADLLILCRLAKLGAGDTILPLCGLSDDIGSEFYHFHPAENIYLVLAGNPSRKLSSSAIELMDCIRSGFAKDTRKAIKNES